MRGVIGFCGRPWETADQMDAALIKRWNDRVRPGDVVYHLGDFLFGRQMDWHRILDQLNGEIHLIEGNHDRQNLKQARIKARFASVQPFLELKINDPESEFGGKQRIVMCHYAMLTWRDKRYGSWMLHGHSHNTLEDRIDCHECGVNVVQEQKRLDVGVDAHNYAPHQLHRDPADHECETGVGGPQPNTQAAPQMEARVLKAWRRLLAAVCRLVKYERRNWTARLPEAREAVKQARAEYIKILEERENELRE